jgi:hypothetical protein
MANSRPDSSAFVAENEIDVALADAYPNPTREGCPSAKVIESLARRERAVDDPDWRHIFKCSPCYREVRSLQQASGERREGVEQPRRRWLAATAAAAVLAIGIVGVMFLTSRSDRAAPGLETAARPSPAADTTTAQLDLRKFTVARSERTEASPEPTSIPRARLSLTMLLPVGMEAGEYDVQILDSSLASKTSTTGRAEIREYVPTLHASLDSTNLAPGPYQLAIRRQGDDWRLFPITVK